jgi:hypothetical protein
MPRNLAALLLLFLLCAARHGAAAPLLGAEFTTVPSGLCDILPAAVGSFVIPGTSAPPPLDERGWPLADAAIEVFDARPSGTADGGAPVDPSAFVPPGVYGDYAVSWRGSGALFVPPVLNATVSGASFDAATWTSRATLTLRPPLPALALAVTGSARNASAAPGSGFADLRLLQPSARACAPGALFTPQLAAAVAPFAHLRLMQWSYGWWVAGFANASAPGALSIEWADRVAPTDALWQPKALGAGAPWETAVRLAQETRKGLWLNVPVQASGAAISDAGSYAHELAALLRDGSAATGGAGLPPDLPVYIEHANEVFLNESQGGPSLTYLWNRAAAEREVAADPASPLAAGGCRDPEVWALRRHVRRVAELGGIFKAAFGAAGAARVRPVVALCAADPAGARAALAWLRDTAGPAALASLYGLAVNSYAVAGIAPGGGALGEVLAAVRAASAANAAPRAAFAALAREFGLALVSYEGALVALPVLRDAATTGQVILANRAAGWGEEVVRDYAQWAAAGGGAFNFFALSSQYGEDAPAEVFQWGLTEDLGNTSTAKFQAVRAILAGAAA